MKIAALQMVSTPRWEDNRSTASALLAQAAAQGAELAVLPEYFGAMGARDTDKLALRETHGAGPMQDFLAHSARTLGLWIVGGTLPLACESPDHVRNTSLVYAPDGRCVARYDKIHLFRFEQGSEQYDEGRVIQAGAEPVQFDLHSRSGERWRVGLSVCYDLRFPELYRQHAQAGADLLLVPSAFTHTTGQAHWEVLLRARAIENQAYVIAPAQGGYHISGRETHGDSMIVDPWGNVLDRLPRGSGVVIAGINPAYQAGLRQSLPALKHRTLECAKGIKVDVITS